MKKKQDFKGVLKKIYTPEKLRNSEDQKQIVLIETVITDEDGDIKERPCYEMTFFIKAGQTPKIDPEALKNLIDKKVKGVCFLNPFEYDGSNNSGKRWALGINLHSIEERIVSNN